MQGALALAEANLRYCTILSPIDGTVVANNVTVGQSVAASLQAPVVFSIAQDLTRMQVAAATDEPASCNRRLQVTRWCWRRCLRRWYGSW